MLILISVIILVKLPRLYCHRGRPRQTWRSRFTEAITPSRLEAGQPRKHRYDWRRRNRGDSHFSTSEVCGVCLQSLPGEENVRRLSCDHLFHTRCADSLRRERHEDCPLCKSVFISDRQ
ncbi:uncharacterized protein B0J16DRAFT_333735 [Fusarium flagelliforme]|uniref:uncharacterized protein n=1 Tax=Fusarium flagelliforme TaxID=2675880 RepID=UPI001E8E0037|nr:uncharacterized protein B0J16DRAFT_333735 [Fusarium flagelliforme]KAH7192780.1 hypothetical protein B0J16DRAFT_333735 [Fusarium flagelliforme]